MVLFASSSRAASDIAAALGSAGFEASFEPRSGAGAYSVSVEVAEDREAEVLDIAKAADPAFQTR